jgi:hypothetical protein
MIDQSLSRAAGCASAIRKAASLFLAIYFAIQSYLQKLNPLRSRGEMACYRRRQGWSLALYGAVVAVGTVGGQLAPPESAARAGFLGLVLPGLGFLNWSFGDQSWIAVGWMAASLLAFALSLLIWFGTGNVLAPLAAWGAAALVAIHPDWVALEVVPVASGWPFSIGPVLWAAAGLVWTGSGRSSLPPAPAARAIDRSWIPARDGPDELSFEDLQRHRLLLDRALQPVEDFEGFEWRDQFQTAAVRYQVNFLAYALAAVQRRHAPAADACFAEAQARLLYKIGDHRLWRYWQLENAWGRLRLDADPVPDQNIMYSGFTALQMALPGLPDDLVLHRQGREWRRYSLDAIADRLDQQYRVAPYGLLACEPNWIYPLCNLITATGIKASDGRTGRRRWPDMAAGFRSALLREGTRADGRFIAFRSALTGVAPPAPGGIVMQSFPCLFLNSLDPALAHERWDRVRGELDRGDWKRLFWPVDVGNYGFSRAAGYAATAAAAAELGDTTIAQECVQRLDAECPLRSGGGVIHRSRASLWAHCLETIARSVGPGGFSDLVATPPHTGGPRLARACYPEVLIARAVANDRSLELVLYPGTGAEASVIEIGGLLPDRHYLTGLAHPKFLRADATGSATLAIPLRGRTHLSIELLV